MSTTQTRTIARIVADYDLFGDITDEDFTQNYFEFYKNRGDILDYRVLDITEGEWGLRHVTFTIDVPKSKVEVIDSVGTVASALAANKKRDELAGAVAAAIVNETDVAVRFVAFL